MITSPLSAFQYTAEERDSIAIAAPAKLNDADWRALGQIAATCPSAISAIPNKTLVAIGRASKKLVQLLEKLSLAPDRYRVWSPELSALLILIREQPFHASTKGHRKSTLKHVPQSPLLSSGPQPMVCTARRPRRFFNEICTFLQQPWRARGQRSGKPLRAFRHCRSRARAASGWV
jgi:hypothetical protein